MPRRPLRQGKRKRRSCFSKPQFLAFSPFARSVSLFASRRPSNSKSRPKIPSESRGNHALKEKIQRPESSDEDEHEDTVQADFAFFDPKPDDFHGVKILLQTYLNNEQWDLSGLVDLILGQTTVGTVVKIDDEEDDGLFSVITALNLGRYKDHQCIIELKKYLLKVCQDKDVKSDLNVLLGEKAKDVGLLVSQRVVNLPPQLLPPQYDALFDEVSWAIEDEPTAELRDSFRFKFYLLITRIYKNKNAEQQKGASKVHEPIIYIKPEDEIFHKLSSWSFTYPLHTQEVAAHEASLLVYA
ncbi:protein BCCIP homolog isoform X2 [Magnolia sinica]|uniref:protein BCCIP homolog isoform X2 n=1 Tax=Magnolia sinica TaxID=86752 RepID=UPI00265AFB3D|nr:protein BCCIP homolog isoform X2 [Magnolia sinica]